MTAVTNQEIYLFVYGSLRKAMNHPLHFLLERYAGFVGSGVFQGRLYDLGRYPGAVPSKANTDRVVGEVYRFAGSEEILKVLDNYEGHRFRRARVPIVLENNENISCWIYLYARRVSRRARISSGDYIAYRRLI
jgi:gamma-glutamylcyclotransferase (GGCT)/AIG2-like uncharacterized protein YtfP